MNFLIVILIIYLYLFGKLIIKYKKQIMKLRYSLYGDDYGSDYDSDLESGDSSDSEIVVDDQYIVNSDLELHLE